jgi:hypothetical protein
MKMKNWVGIITETDIFDAFIDILGVSRPHTRIDFTPPIGLEPLPTSPHDRRKRKKTSSIP